MYKRQELQDRIAYFFKECFERGEIPTWEKLCLAIGYSRSTVWDLSLIHILRNGAGRIKRRATCACMTRRQALEVNRAVCVRRARKREAVKKDVYKRQSMD